MLFTTTPRNLVIRTAQAILSYFYFHYVYRYWGQLIRTRRAEGHNWLYTMYRPLRRHEKPLLRESLMGGLAGMGVLVLNQLIDEREHLEHVHDTMCDCSACVYKEALEIQDAVEQDSIVTPLHSRTPNEIYGDEVSRLAETLKRRFRDKEY